ncbi:MAG: tRNA epoxyqueuosine(34) reductase QueG [Verrucomicrobiota bacterium]
MTPEELKGELLAKTRELGFDECRIAPAGPAPHGDAFRQWIEDGCHGDMAWMAKNPDRRTDPRQVLEGVRSILVLATNYHQTVEEKEGRGRIAQYAWGRDYHDVVEKRLRLLREWLSERGGTQRTYVDTGPILERDFASEAGLGWTGKSTVQIHHRLGTWFFLSEVLTTLLVPPDPPIRSYCGTCTRCIDACPTDAITEPHRVDARRCISYLTIEHKGAIPEEFRRPMGDRIFGCDECLDVCPWNRFAQEAEEAKFQAREYVTKWDLRDFLAQSDEEFRKLFSKSPIKRTKRDRFLRNVCVALGNVGTREDLPALEKAVAEEGALVAEHARWAIREIWRREGKTADR